MNANMHQRPKPAPQAPKRDNKSTPRSGTRPGGKPELTTTTFSETDIAEANNQIERAFGIAGLVDGSNPRCPECGTSTKDKVKVKTSTKTGRKYWKCYRCSAHGDAIALLKAVGIDFPTAVNELLGRPTRNRPTPRTDIPVIAAEPAFTAVVDVEVYDFVRDAGSLEQAQKYYAIWHIHPKAVEEAGSRYLTETVALQTELLTRFGRQRLLDCGVITVGDDGKDYFLFNENYPVIEPHLHANGHVVGMQFRPSFERMKLVAAHKAWKRRWSGITDPVTGEVLDPKDAWEQAAAKDPSKAGRRVKYVTPFLSIRGAGTDSLIGCGLPRLASLDAAADVYVVEGFKDLMAARTMRAEAYAIPGTGVMPPKLALDVLRKHRMVVTLDGDAAGAKGRATLMGHLAEHGVEAREKTDMPDGLDVTDILVQRHAHAGCGCDTCTAWRRNDPPRATCTCQSCKKQFNS